MINQQDALKAAHSLGQQPSTTALDAQIVMLTGELAHMRAKFDASQLALRMALDEIDLLRAVLR